MEVKKYNPFVVIKPKPKPKPKVKLEARGLALENKKKLDIIFAKVLLILIRNSWVLTRVTRVTIRAD